MNVKIVSVTDKREDHATQGHGAEGKEGEAVFRADNRLLIMTDNGLLTSTILKITVETRNSIYVLENTEVEQK